MKGFNKLIVVTFLCAVFCFDWSIQDKKNINIPKPLVLMFREKAEICGKDIGVPPSYLMKIIDKTLPNELSSLQFFHCVLVKSGFGDESGKFNVDKMASFEVVDGSAEDYVNKIKECNNNVKADNLQTLDAVSDCLHGAYHFAPKTSK